MTVLTKEDIGRRSGRSGLSGIQCMYPTVARPVDEPERPATEPRCKRLNDTESTLHRRGRIDSITTGPQYRCSSRGCQGMG
jgi:hypothetical protein